MQFFILTQKETGPETDFNDHLTNMKISSLPHFPLSSGPIQSVLKHWTVSDVSKHIYDWYANYLSFQFVDCQSTSIMKVKITHNSVSQMISALNVDISDHFSITYCSANSQRKKSQVYTWSHKAAKRSLSNWYPGSQSRLALFVSRIFGHEEASTSKIFFLRKRNTLIPQQIIVRIIRSWNCLKMNEMVVFYRYTYC